MLQDTLWHVGRLFLSQHGPDYEALLPGMVQEDSMSGELLFGPLPGTDSPAASEAEAWKVALAFQPHSGSALDPAISKYAS